MAIFNNQDPQRESNVGQFGATDESIGAYKQAAEYAKDAEYWAKISQQGIKSVEDLLVVVQDLYEKGELQLAEIEQLKRDFAAQDVRLMQLISQTNAVIKNANDTIDDMDAKMAEVQKQLDILLAMDVSVTTLPPGSDATGNYNPDTGLISLGIPEGKPGADGSVTDLTTAPMGVPDPSDWGFFVESTDSKVYRAKMSDIAKTFPSVQSVSYNGGTQKETGDINITKAKLGLGSVLDVPSYSKTESDNLGLPLPDVWAPMNDDLRLLAGFAPYDKLTISGKVLELPSKQIPFTRSTTATYIDKSGIVQTADINEPRFEREGLLMEGQSTNSMLYSGDLNAAWWPKARCTTTSGFAAPDGSNSATKLMPTSELGSHYISKTLPVTTGSVYTLSYFVKAGEYTGCRLSFSGTLVPDGKSCDFDLVAGTMRPLSGSSGTPTMTPLSNGWYRCSITSDTIASDGTVNFNIWVLDENGNTSGFAGDGVKGIYVWGAQLEVNPVLTSYIPTTTAEATRTQETLRLQPSGNIGYGVVGDLINRTTSFEISVNSFVPTSAGYFNLLATVGVQNDVILRIATSAVNSLRSSGSISPSIPVTYPFSRQIYTQTIDTNNTLTSYFNGQVGSRTGAPTTPTGVPTTVNFSSTVQLVYHIRNFRIWHRLLTPNQIRGIK